MPSWNDLINEVNRQPDDDAKTAFLQRSLNTSIEGISNRRSGRNVIFYASAFLQKPAAQPGALALAHEEINGFMSVIHGMDCSKGLTLLLHSPGGVTNAAETIVAYLCSKFDEVEAIVPTFAMSAATMVALSAQRIVMGRQSQLGPIDPQMPIAGRFVSARAVVEQFERATTEILEDRAKAHVWAPILQSVGPALLQEAQNALDYGEIMVAKWLAARMCAGVANPIEAGRRVAQHFNDASTHKSHGRRIDRDEARGAGVVVDDLESDQDLQEHVLTAYHILSIIFEISPACKILVTNHRRMWIKNATAIRVPPGLVVPGVSA
jgi:hypothetical protein